MYLDQDLASISFKSRIVILLFPPDASIKSFSISYCSSSKS
jgi:hypothetical protein